MLSSKKGQEDFAWQLRKCGKSGAKLEGKHLHSRIMQLGLDRGTFLGNLIVQMYGSFGDIQEAGFAFDKIETKNVFSWTLLFTAYAQNGHLDEARSVFDKMPEKDVVAWTAMLAAYAQKGHVYEAKEIFDKMPLRDLVSWNAMLAAYGQNAQYNDALLIYRLMQQDGRQPNATTFVSILDVWAGLVNLSEGRAVHRIIIYAGLETEVTVGTALVNMYGKCGELTQARNLLEKMPEKHLIMWTAMLTAYAQNGRPVEAREIFLRMDLEGFQPDDVTYVSAMYACTCDSSLSVGRLIHENIRVSEFSSETNVGNTLITFYGKCGCVSEAWLSFGCILYKNVPSWNAMLGAYADNALVEETLQLYLHMLLEGVFPDNITFVPVLSACSHGGLLKEGCYHFSSIIMEYNLVQFEEHFMCILDILGRSGELEVAEAFASTRSLKEFKGDGWSTVLSACKMHGDSVRGARVGKNLMLENDSDSGAYILLSDVCAAEGRER